MNSVQFVRQAVQEGRRGPSLNRLRVILKYQGSHDRTLAAALLVLYRSGGRRAGSTSIVNVEAALLRLARERVEMLFTGVGKGTAAGYQQLLRSNDLSRQEVVQAS